jgi:hypothetical protein
VPALDLDSAIGIGTTVRLYLPPSRAPARGKPRQKTAQSS